MQQMAAALVAALTASDLRPALTPLTDPCQRDERGASLVEYALLVALIALVCIGAVTMLGGVLADKYSSAASGLG
jgi:pilus assembly protein Flp/PilA